MASRNSQPIIDQYNFQAPFGGGGTVNLPITISQQGAILILLAKFDGNGTPTAVKFNGNDMTLLVTQTSASASAHIFAYINPPVGNWNVTYTAAGIGSTAFRAISIIGAQQSLSSLITGSLGAGSTNTWAVPIQVAAANSLVLATGDGVGGGEAPDERPLVYPADSFDYKSPGPQTMTWRVSTTDTFEGVNVAIGPARAPSIWNSNVETRNSMEGGGAANGVPTLNNWGNHPAVFWRSSFLHTIGRLAGAQAPALLINVSDSSTVTESVSMSWPLAETFQDNFDFGGIDSGKWTSSGSGITIGTLLDVEITTNNDYQFINSINLYNLTGSYMYSQVTDAGNQSLASFEVYPVYLTADSNNKLFVRISGNVVQPIKVVGGVTTNVGAGVAYNSTNMKYFRIREASGTTFWDYATDPTSTWTNITSAANPITVTSVTLEILVGTWNNENSTAKLDNVNTYPTQYQFSWKGLTWNQRIHAGSPSNHQGWLPTNITGPDGSDYLTFTLSNPGANYPFGGEIFSATRGFGYGIYTTVVGTRLDTMDHRIGWGGPFTFDFTQFPAYREIDIAEIRDYNSNPNIRILHSHVYDNAGSAAFIVDDQDVNSAAVQTHRLIWTPDSLTFDSYSGTGTGGTLLFHTVQSTNLPTPSLERMHFNIWSNTGVANYQFVSPFSVVLRDFVFASLDQVSVSDSTTVTDVATLKIIDSISVFDASTVTDVPTVVIPIISEIINDASTVTDVPTVVVVDLISVFDASNLTESVTVNIPTVVQTISVFDASTVTDVIVQVLKIHFISVNDASTVTDVITQVLITDFVSVNDTSTVTDVITQVLQIYNINVSDSSTVSESITMDVPIKASVFDASTVTDVPTVVVVDLVSVFDASTITESLTVNIPVLISVNDASTVTDVIVQVLKINNVSVFDASTVTDVIVQVLKTNFVSVNDASTATDVPTIIRVNLISVTESTTVWESFAGSLTYNGSTQYGTFTTIARTAGQPLTAVAWINTANAGASHRVIIGARNGSLAGQLWKLETNGNLPAFEYDPVGGGVAIAGSTSVADGRNHLLVAVYDGTNTILYVDGTQVAISGSFPSAAITTTAGAIGRQTNSSAEYFAGAIGQTYIFSRALSGAEISSYYSTGVLDLTSVENAYLMEEGTGTTLTDSSGNARTVTLVATPTWSSAIGVQPGQVLIRDFVSVFDSSTVLDIPTVVIPIYNISVFDATTITEALTVTSVDDESIFDATTVTEDITILISTATSVFDSSTVTDVPTVVVVYFISVNETPTAYDFRLNMMNNPSFEANYTDGWNQFATSGTPVRTWDNTVSFVGGASYKHDANGGNTDSGLDWNFTLTPGTYRLSGYIKTQNITGDAKLVLRNRTNFNADINLTVGNTPTSQDWQRVSGIYTVTATDSFDVVLGLGPYGAPSQGIAWFDGIILEQTTADEAYFDGNTGGSWTGATNNSTSTLGLVTLQIANTVSVFDATTVTDVPTVVITSNISVSDSSTVYDNLSWAIAFDGVNGQVIFTAASPMTTTTPVTIVTWVSNRFDATNSANAQNFLAYQFLRMYFRQGSGVGKSAARIRFDESVAHEANGASRELSSGDWSTHFYAGTYDWTGTTNTTLKFYVDAILTQTTNSTVLPTSNYTGTQGQIGKTGANFFKGDIQEVRIYHSVLSQANITSLYNTNIDPVAPQVSLNFREGTGSTMTDDSGNGQTATLSGGATWITGIESGQAQVLEIDLISVFDSTTVTDVPTVRTTYNVNVSDATTVSESITLNVPINLSVFDSTTVTDVPTVVLVNLINVFDASTVTDVPNVLVPILVSVFEASTVTESLTVLLINLVSVFDTSTVTDIITQILMTDFVSVFDTTSVSESTTVMLIDFISVVDTSTVTDVITQVLKIHFISVNDTSTVTEALTVQIPYYLVNVWEDTTVTEALNVEIIDLEEIFDSSTVTDALVQIMITSFVSVFDASTATESINVAPFYVLSVGDDTTATEDVVVEVIDFESLFDASTVTDSSTVEVVYLISKFEATTVTDVITANPTYVLSVSDSSIVTDVLFGQNGGIYLNPLDITIYEKVSPTPRLILVEGRLAYLVVDGPIPYYVWV